MTVDYEALAAEDAVEGAGGDALARLAALVNRQRDLERDVAEAEVALKELRNELRGLSERDVPALLDELQLSEIRLADGTKVAVREDLKATTAGKHRDAVIAWLTEHGHDDLVKDVVSVQFGKGEGARADELVTTLDGGGYPTQRVRSVHPQSFAALLRELLADGVEVPLDDLGVFVLRRTVLS